MLVTEEKGFTLVEVVIALLLLSLVTVVVVRIYNSGFFAIALGGKKTEAVYEVQDLLEQAISSSAEQLADDNDAEEHELTIRFIAEDGQEKEVSVFGYLVTKESRSKFGKNVQKVSATVFVPICAGEDEGEAN